MNAERMNKERWFVAGARGFVGSAVVGAAEAAGVEVVSMPLRHASYQSLRAAMDGCTVIVNAAGLAAPGSQDKAALEVANRDLVRDIAAAAVETGAAKLIHVSSGSVQGARRTLDDSQNYAPFSPYTESKMEAEVGLLGGCWAVPPITVVYRPATIMGAGREMTASLLRFYSFKVAPLFGDGSQSMPVATIDRVGDAVAFLGRHAEQSGIASHPWEGMTQARLAAALIGDRTRLVKVPIPDRAIAASVGARLPARFLPVGRRIDLLLYGQQQSATYLDSIGFPSTDQTDSFRALRDHRHG